MEFPQLGEQCSWPQCKTLDFLPFKCSHCSQIYCKNHFNPTFHECESFKSSQAEPVATKTFTCFYDKCDVSGPIEMPCPKCLKHFCLTHRYHTCFDVDPDIELKKKQWNEPREKFAKSIKEVQKSVDENIRKALLNPKKAATAIKVQLMKLKGKASGSPTIPTADRLYFLVAQPKTLKKESKAVYVSKDWSVGKAIDSISNLCSVTNRNNEMNSPKLKLFKFDGTQIASDTSTKMNDLIESNQILNGDSLILEYVDPCMDSNSFVLNDCSQYT